MENFETSPVNLEDEKKGLISQINELAQDKIIRLAKLLEFGDVERTEDALRFIINAVKDAPDKSETERIQMKISNLDEIEI